MSFKKKFQMVLSILTEMSKYKYTLKWYKTQGTPSKACKKY